MDELKVGFIGTGRISDLHALEYLANDRARIVAVCDTNLDLARQRGLAWGVSEDRIFADYHDLLAVPEVDLVEILLVNLRQFWVSCWKCSSCTFSMHVNFSFLTINFMLF